MAGMSGSGRAFYRSALSRAPGRSSTMADARDQAFRAGRLHARADLRADRRRRALSRVPAVVHARRSASKRPGATVLATLAMRRGPLRTEFTTRNVMQPAAGSSHEARARPVPHAGRALDARSDRRQPARRSSWTCASSSPTGWRPCCSSRCSRRRPARWSMPSSARPRRSMRVSCAWATLRCEVVYARCDRQRRRAGLALPEAGLRHSAAASLDCLLPRWPTCAAGHSRRALRRLCAPIVHCRTGRQAWAIFGRVCEAIPARRDGDRIELYRPLQVDPREESAVNKPRGRRAGDQNRLPAVASVRTRPALQLPASGGGAVRRWRGRRRSDGPAAAGPAGRRCLRRTCGGRDAADILEALRPCRLRRTRSGAFHRPSSGDRCAGSRGSPSDRDRKRRAASACRAGSAPASASCRPAAARPAWGRGNCPAGWSCGRRSRLAEQCATGPGPARHERGSVERAGHAVVPQWLGPGRLGHNGITILLHPTREDHTVEGKDLRKAGLKVTLPAPQDPRHPRGQRHAAHVGRRHLQEPDRFP